MIPSDLNSPEYLDVQATVARERPAIHRKVEKIIKLLSTLSDVSQKQAICELTAVWISALYPDDPKMALSLSDAMREQTDIYITSAAQYRQQH